MVIIVTGDRHWTDYERVDTVLTWRVTHATGPVYLVHGDAKGVDTCARASALRLNERGFGVIPVGFPAEWYKNGQLNRGAGPTRNQQMLDIMWPVDLCLAFHDDLFSSSKGTLDMVRRTLDAHVPTFHYTTQGGPFELTKKAFGRNTIIVHVGSCCNPNGGNRGRMCPHSPVSHSTNP